jgi:phage tail sheath protein FI
MPETLHPGVYVFEKPAASPLVSVGTSACAIVGNFQKGPINKATLVTSFTDFQTKFGGFFPGSIAPDAVYGFFNNGGSRMYVVRASKTNPLTAGFDWLDSSANVVFRLDASSPGAWGNNIDVTVSAGTVSNTYKITVTDTTTNTEVESFDNIVLSPVTDSNYISNVLAASNYLVVSSVNPSFTPELVTNSLVGGSDGSGPVDYIGSSSAKTGIYALDEINGENFQIIIPDSRTVATVSAGISYCENRKDCFYLWSNGGSVTSAQSAVSDFSSFNVNSSYGAFYAPHIYVQDFTSTISGTTKLLPPEGHLAGIYARTDKNRDVSKAPAGVDAVVVGALGLEVKFSDSDSDVLNPNRVNAIRLFSDAGIIVWGARTATTNGSLKYIAVRRNLMNIATTMKLQTRWVVFEPNDKFLWGKIRSVLSAYLRTRYNDGALFGDTADKAFYVQCDGTINTNDTINQGKVIAKVGVRPTQTAEFFIIDLAQWDGGSSASIS